jgi:hypothetical protein
MPNFGWNEDDDRSVPTMVLFRRGYHNITQQPHRPPMEEDVARSCVLRAMLAFLLRPNNLHDLASCEVVGIEVEVAVVSCKHSHDDEESLCVIKTLDEALAAPQVGSACMLSLSGTKSLSYKEIVRLLFDESTLLVLALRLSLSV